MRVTTQGCRGRFRRATTSCATGPEDPQDWIALDWLPWGTFAVDRSLRERTAQPRLGRGTKYDPGVSIRRGKAELPCSCCRTGPPSRRCDCGPSCTRDACRKRGNYHLPIVFTLGADPFAFGVLTAREPQGGNITGLTEIAPKLTPKRLEPPREIMPAITRAAILSQPGTLRDETFG